MAKSNLAKSLYKSLFGGRGPVDGNLIDMAEHGRTGGISTGQGFKTTRYVDEKVILDEVDADNKYVGTAAHGTATSAAAWQIMKIATVGTITTISYADGDDNYDNVWDNRASLSYS